jgi:YVTN family beta-propeller protein
MSSKDSAGLLALVSLVVQRLAAVVFSVVLVSVLIVGVPAGFALAATAEEVTDTIPVGGAPFAIALNAQGTTAYVPNRDDGTVSVIDTATNLVTATILVDADGQPTGVALTPDGTKLYVANSAANTVSVINTATNLVDRTINFLNGDGPRGVAVSPNGANVYVTNFNRDTVNVIDTGSHLITATISTGDEGPWGVTVSPDSAKIYVVHRDSNSVRVITAAGNTVSDRISVGAGPRGVALNPAGTKAYVTNNQSKTVIVIDTVTKLLTATVPVGVGPFGVAVDPAGTKVYVTIFNDRTVTVISVSALSSAVSASEVSAGMPGIFLYVAGSPGRLAEGTPLYHGSANIAPNTSYTLSVQSMDARGSTKTVLSTGTTKGRGTVNERSELGSLAAGSYKIVMTGYHPLGYPLVLTNHISVDAAGKLVSVSPESLQPTLQ